MRYAKLLLPTCALFLACAAFAADPTRSFDLPAGDAGDTLRRFAQQAGREIVYPAQEVRGEQTNAVRGELQVALALRQLLAGTRLVAELDKTTGAFAVRKRTAPSRAEAGPANATGLSNESGGGLDAGSRLTGESTLLANTGAITGRVQNVFVGVYLEGARVELVGTNRVVLTDREGRYNLPRVAPGPAVLRITYTGLNPQSVTVEVGAGARATRDIELTSEIYEMARYVVSDTREGQAAAITEQRNAANVKNVVATDAFGNLADGNAAEFVKRLSGVAATVAQGEARFIVVRGIDPSLNTVSMDGMKMPTSGGGANRNANLSEISIEGIESIEVTKSPTPDMDGDSLGGNINMKPKSVLDRAKPRMFSYMFSMNSRFQANRNRLTSAWTLGYQDVLGDKRNLGITVNLSSSSNFIPQEYVQQAWQPVATSPAYLTSFLILDGITERRRDGASMRLDYRLGDSTRLNVNAYYTYYRAMANYGGSMTITPLAQVAALDASGRPIPLRPEFPFGHPSYVPAGFNAAGTRVAASILPGYTDYFTEVVNATAQISRTLNTAITKRYSLQGGGRTVWRNTEIDYTGTYSESPTVTGQPQQNADRVRGYTISIPRTDWRFDGRRSIIVRDVAQTGGLDLYDANNWTVSPFTRNVTNQGTNTYGGQVNVKRRFQTTLPFYLKTGAKYMVEERYTRQQTSSLTYAGPKSALAGLRNTSYHYDPLGGKYAMPPYIDHAKVDQLLASHPEYFVEDRQATLRARLTNDKSADEAVWAGYVMGGFTLGKLSTLAGIRVEKTYVSGITAVQDPLAAAGLTDPTAITLARYGRRSRVKRDYTNPLPGVHLKYEPAPNWLVRASYAASFGRPSFTSIYPDTNIDYNAQRITRNNPGLKPQSADNFDVTVERYFEPVGVVSAGVFQKQIKNFLYSSVFTIPAGSDNGFDGEYTGWSLATQANGGYGRVRGLELNYSQQLSFLKGVWSGAGVYANYTRLESLGNYGVLNAPPTGNLVNFTPKVGNVGLSYSRGRISARVSANYLGRYLFTYNANPLLLTWIDARTMVDVHLQYSLAKAINIFADANNVLNSKFSRSSGFEYRKIILEENSVRLNCGVSGRF